MWKQKKIKGEKMSVTFKIFFFYIKLFDCTTVYCYYAFFPQNGLPSAENSYIFNGDFVDRGKNSMEIIIILFAFLLLYPDHMHLNRGNHEDHIMNLRSYNNHHIHQYRYVLNPKKISAKWFTVISLSDMDLQKK